MVLVLLLVVTMTLPAADKPHYVTAPRADLKQDILWGATSVSPEGFELSFGGIDQKSDDGRPHKRIKLDGAWVSIADERARRNPHQMEWMKAVKEAETITLAVAWLRFSYFDGETAIRKHLGDAEQIIAQAVKAVDGPELIAEWYQRQLRGEIVAEHLAAEPGGRCLSSMVWEPKQKVFVIFGGDHLDFLRNDLWIVDQATLPGFLRENAYLPDSDTVLILGATLPPAGDSKSRRTLG